MSRLLARNSTKAAKEPNYVRGMALCLLVLISIFSIYSIGLRHGTQQYSIQDTLLTSLVAPAYTTTIAATTTTTTTNSGPVEAFVPPGGDHRKASPPEVLRHILDIPEGEAQALPSIRVEAPDNDARVAGATKYGGKGDKQHLGGFTSYDRLGVSPATWDYMMSNLGVQSLMDVGCGKGVSTLYFLEQGADVLCLEGSHDAVTQTLLPDPEKQVVEHDFSRGPYWPGKTYDAVWSVEFLEHVGRNFQYNYIKAFRKAALIFVTHSRWGGWYVCCAPVFLQYWIGILLTLVDPKAPRRGTL